MIFYCMKNTKDIYKLKVLFLLAIARYAQSTQNSKFPIIDLAALAGLINTLTICYTSNALPPLNFCQLSIWDPY